MATRTWSRVSALTALVCSSPLGCGTAENADGAAGAPAAAAPAAAGSSATPSPTAGSPAAQPAAAGAAAGAQPASQPTAAGVAAPSTPAAGGTPATTPTTPTTPATPNSPSTSTPTPAEAGSGAVAPTTPTEIPDAFMADAGEGWKTLVIGRWEVPPGDEIYQCVRFTIPEATNVTSFRALSPPGTHHTFLMVNDTADTPDGVESCSAATIGDRNITGSGVGTNDFNLPESVAIQLKAGQQLILNLHLFNTNDTAIKGVSGTLVKVADEANVTQFAEGVLAGPVGLMIPPGASTQSGTCTFDRDGTIFGVIPHMHQLGVHLKAVAHSSMMGDVVLSDRPYDFESQIVYPLTPEVQMKAGDTIAVDCTYENTTNRVVSFGESSLDEMCFAGLYRYPAGSGGFICAF